MSATVGGDFVFLRGAGDFALQCDPLTAIMVFAVPSTQEHLQEEMELDGLLCTGSAPIALIFTENIKS